MKQLKVAKKTKARNAGDDTIMPSGSLRNRRVRGEGREERGGVVCASESRVKRWLTWVRIEEWKMESPENDLGDQE